MIGIYYLKYIRGQKYILTTKVNVLVTQLYNDIQKTFEITL